MSDSFIMLVDSVVTERDANAFSAKIVAEFQKLGIIEGKLNADCVLSGKGYSPGPAIERLYKLGKRELPFWKLEICGVQPIVGRSFNELLDCERFVCPSCDAEIDAFEDGFIEVIFKACAKWVKDGKSVSVPCPSCGKKKAVANWESDPPLGLGNLSFRFWNWPPFDAPGWKTQLPKIVEQATGHNIVSTYGRI